MTENHESMLRAMLGLTNEKDELPERLKNLYADYKRLRDRVDMSPMTPMEMGCLILMSGAVGTAKDSPIDRAVTWMNTSAGDMVIVAEGAHKGPAVIKKRTATGFEIEAPGGAFDIPLAHLRRS